MWIIAAIVCFVLSLLFNLWAIQHGHLGWATLAIAGLLCLSVHFAVGSDWHPWRRKDA